MTASARTGGVPILSVLSVPARAFLLGTVAISLVAIALRYAVGVDDTVLFVVSAGLLAIFGVLKIINFAHGAWLTVGGYCAVAVVQAGYSPWLSLPVAFAVVAILGGVTEFLIVRPLYRRPLDAILATWGLGIVIGQLITLWFGRDVQFTPNLLSGTVDVLGTSYSIYRLFMIAAALAIGLGFDAAVPGLMKRKPRDASAPIVDRGLAIRLGGLALVMAAIALGVVAWGEDRYDLAVATTMGLTTLSLMHIVAALEVREPTQTVFSRYTLENRRFVQLIGITLALTFLVTELDFLQRIFDTVSLTSTQWGICLLGPIVYLAITELVKALDRRSGHGRAALLPAEA